MFASEAHYHRSCHRAFTTNLETETAADARTSEDITATNVVQDNLKYKLLQCIHESLVTDINYQSMIEIYNMYSNILLADGKDHNLTKIDKTWIRRVIEKELGGIIHLHSMKNGKVLLVPANLTTVELAERLFTTQEELKELQKCNQTLIQSLLMWLRFCEQRYYETKQICHGHHNQKNSKMITFTYQNC